MNEDAIIARVAFPHCYGNCICLLGRDRRLLHALMALAAEARGYGWTIKDGEAYLPPEMREAFAAAIGLPLEKLTERMVATE